MFTIILFAAVYSIGYYAGTLGHEDREYARVLRRNRQELRTSLLNRSGK